MTQSSSQHRAISTVVDVALALVLISGAIALVAIVPHDQPDSGPEHSYAVETLSATTVNFTYSTGAELAAVSTTATGNSADDKEATAQAFAGSLARGLAVAAVANATAGEKDQVGSQQNVSDQSFRERLETEITNVKLLDSAEWQVHAIWELFEGSNSYGKISFGQPPPADVETTVSQQTVPSGFRNGDAQLKEGTDNSTNQSDSFERLSRTLATVVVDGLLKPQQTQRQLTSTENDRERALVRIHNLMHLIEDSNISDSEIEEHLSAQSVMQRESDSSVEQSLREQFIEKLSTQFYWEFREEFSTPVDAQQAIALDEVTIAVTEWNR